MGVSSNTLHLRGVDTRAVARGYAAMLRRRGWRLRRTDGIPHYRETHDDPAFRRVLVSRPMNGWITVIDQYFDTQHLRGIERVTAEMSVIMREAAVSLVLLDGEALCLFAWQDGDCIDRWCSWPGWHTERPASPEVRARWRGHPERLLSLCRSGVSEPQLARIMRNYADDAPGQPYILPEDVLRQLQEVLTLEGGPRTYAALHAQVPPIRLCVPGRIDPLHLTHDVTTDDYWSAFTPFHFMRL